MSEENIITLQFDKTLYPQFIEAFKARYFVDTEEAALERLHKEVLQLYTYGRQQLLAESLGLGINVIPSNNT